ncbi:MAG: replication initiation protein [Lachnospiraceae bacterium]|nr:replication initiation protein [Lachnospiraceae bacterium]
MDFKREGDSSALYYQNSDYVKSNLLIGAKYKSSLLENKVMAISLNKIKDAEEDKEGTLIVRLKASELKKLLDSKSGSFYSQLDKIGSSMTGRVIGMSDPINESFHYMSVINNAHYENGVLTLEYNKNLNGYLKNIKQNFTKLNLETMLDFKSVYSFRLYELLKSRAYYPRGEKRKDNAFVVTYDLPELKLDLGVINAELASVQKILNNSKRPNYEAALEASPEKVFTTWFEFRRNCIDVAVKEINEKKDRTEMEVDYKPRKSGQGGKVYGVDFYIKLYKKAEESADSVERELSEDEKLNFYDEIRDVIDCGIKSKDAKAIAEAADFDMDMIISKYELAKQQDVDNIVGFMIAAIKNDYTKVPVSESKSKKNSFNSFKQRKYDFEELEKEAAMIG